MLDAVLRKIKESIFLKVRARAGIKQKRLPRIVDIGGGAFALEVTVADQAMEGKANKAIINEIAKWLGVKKADVSIISGHISCIKNIEIVGNADVLTLKYMNQTKR